MTLSLSLGPYHVIESYLYFVGFSEGFDVPIHKLQYLSFPASASYWYSSSVLSAFTNRNVQGIDDRAT